MAALHSIPPAYAALPDKTLVYCSDGSPTGFDANQSVSVLDNTANAEPIYNRLVEYERGGTKLLPSLAESWDISADGRVYAFHLRRGVKFHTTPWFTPEREFNAKDVLFTFERMRNPNMPFRKAYPTLFPYWYSAGLDKVIEKIEASEDLTDIYFTLKSVHAPFLAKLAEPFLSILSAEYAMQLLKEGEPSQINEKPVGTGPFIFQKYIKDEAIYFDGNPEYWRPDDVQLSHLIFSITPDAAVRVQKLKKNECQVTSALRLTDMTALEGGSNLQVISEPDFSMSYLAYNVTHEPLNDLRVRRALDMAIDKKAIIDIVYAGRAQAAVAPMSPTQWSYDKTLQDAPRDIEQAKAWLDEAGYPDGFTLSLWMPVPGAINQKPKLTVEMIQADWKKIGVKAEIVTYEWGEYLKRALKGEHDAMLTGWTSTMNDPDGWLSILSGEAIHGGYNFSKWHDEMFDNLIRRAVQTTDVAERSRLYTQAQRIFKRGQPFTPIAYPTVYQPINKNVINFKINPFGTAQFAGVSLR